MTMKYVLNSSIRAFLQIAVACAPGAARAQERVPSPAGPAVSAPSPVRQAGARVNVPAGNAVHDDLNALVQWEQRLQETEGNAAGRPLPVGPPAPADRAVSARQARQARQARTRDAFSDTLARILGAINAWPLATLQREYDRGSGAVESLIRLVCGFEPELQTRGVDTRAARQRLAALTIPWDHWGHQVIDRVRNAPMVIGDGRETRPRMTRQEFARSVAVFLPPPPPRKPLQPEARQDLRRLVSAFGSELGLIGIDPEAVTAELSEKQNREMENKGISAMEKLHRAGIIVGYPEEAKPPGAAKSGKR
jgi:hypothetical protein